MLWEKKTQLAREARETVNSDIALGEIHTMKTEIHRMEMRYAQLLRQQEKMVQDMEKAVIKRENIIARLVCVCLTYYSFNYIFDGILLNISLLIFFKKIIILTHKKKNYVLLKFAIVLSFKKNCL